MRTRLLAEAQKDRGAKALIARIGRIADFAMAADHGHAHAGAGTENQDRGVLERFEHLCGLRSLPAIGSDNEGRVGLFLERWRVAAFF